jgi:dsDNA-binding SOS-regulon protein
MNATALVLSDLHYPHQDPKYISIATQLIKQLKPDHVCQIGDALDAGSISSYLQDPASDNTFKKEIDLYNKQLDIWQKAMKKGSTFHQLEGNHSERLKRFLARNCREIHDIVKAVPELLRLKERSKSGVKFVWHPLKVWDSCKIGDVYIHHGQYFDKNLAQSNLDRYGVKFLQGHSHRACVASNGKIWSASLGHGSIASKTAHLHSPNTWQQAMGVVTIIEGKGHLEMILVNDGVACFRGKVIRG